MMRRRGVLIIAPDDDIHAHSVAAALSDDHVAIAQTDLAKAAYSDLTVVPANYVLLGSQRIESGWSVWWRRAGVPAPKLGATDAEEALTADETRDIVLGGLLSLGLRWVDEPYTVMRAEQTLFQLACASSSGARTPDTVATNEPAAGRAMARRGAVLAKSISSGSGLAPYAEGINDSDFDLLVGSPTVLQRQIKKRSDLRLVAVGNDVFCWERPAVDVEPIDWRAVDRRGRGFVPADREDVAAVAVEINHSLGLSFGVQDWIIDHEDQAIFLEVNPTGAWLFLAAARDIVAPALARHLAKT